MEGRNSRKKEAMRLNKPFASLEPEHRQPQWKDWQSQSVLTWHLRSPQELANVV